MFVAPRGIFVFFSCKYLFSGAVLVACLAEMYYLLAVCGISMFSLVKLTLTLLSLRA